MVKRWYQYRSKDGKVQGITLARDEAEVARLAGRSAKSLIIERVRWNGKEFEKCHLKGIKQCQ